MVTQRTGAGRGKRREPNEQKRRRGARIRNGLAAVPVPEMALATVQIGVIPNPPATLDRTGAAFWSMLWDGGRRHLSERHDWPLVEKVCVALQEVAAIDTWIGGKLERRFYETANGQLVTHPLVKQKTELNAQITAWLSLLGFTPSDRARLGLAEIRVANELDQYRQRNAKMVDFEEVSAD